MSTRTRKHLGLAATALLLAGLVSAPPVHAESAERTKDGYVHAVVRGAGLMPWQSAGVSPEEVAFRQSIEQRKTDMLARRASVEHPALLDAAALQQAKENVAATEWARVHFESDKALADYLVAQPEGYIEAMVSELTPTSSYGFTCPNCVGGKSQEGTGTSLIAWNHKEPDIIRCRSCGQTYPDERFPETGMLRCPRAGQTFTFYLNDAERANPEDRSGDHAWKWVGHVNHVSFSGAIRQQKIQFMCRGLQSLAYAYALTEDPRYAERGARILVRLAHCYRNWLYHDYWGAFADCDPMYAAWHDKSLPIEWKRHLAESVFANDTLDEARMLQTFWGAGRIHPSTDSISGTPGLCLAHDLFRDAKGSDGQPVWTPEERALVERDLFIERIMGAEPYVGGAGNADCVNNKAPRIYLAMAAVGRCLGLTDFADTSLRGYEGLRDQSFLYDGFSGESPAYTNMYLSSLIGFTETLHGFQWPEGFPGRSGVVDLYKTDPKLGLMFRSVIDQVAPSGGYLPLSDTSVYAGPSQRILEVGLNRYPEYFAGRHPRLSAEASPSRYAAFHLAPEDFVSAADYAPPELIYPAWMTAILRHGSGANASVLAMPFNPPGGHRHTDNLALYYVDSGRTILGDHGYVGDMPVNGWIHNTLSHNLVVVDDAEQIHRGDTPRVPRLHMAATSPYVSVVEASTNAYPQCADYRRLVALFKGPDAQTFVVDVFRVRGGSRHACRLSSDIATSDAADGTLAFEGLDMPDEAPLPDVGNSIESADIFGLRDVRAAESPPANWQAVWGESGRSYRLWMLSQVDAVEASNGPGQTTRGNAGRRLRYVDAVRVGDGLESTFVAVHEPSGPNDAPTIRAVTRLEVPAQAGPDAVAVRIDAAWGIYYVFTAFEEEAELDGIRFQGAFGVVHQKDADPDWLLGLGASTLAQGNSGFVGQPARWSSTVAGSADYSIEAVTPPPDGWSIAPEGFTNYVVAHDGAHWTGFPIEKINGNTLRVRRFAMPEVREFAVPAMRFETRAQDGA